MRYFRHKMDDAHDRTHTPRAGRPMHVVHDTRTGEPSPLSAQVHYLHRDLNAAVKALPNRIAERCSGEIIDMHHALEELTARADELDRLDGEDRDVVLGKIASWSEIVCTTRGELFQAKGQIDDGDELALRRLLNRAALEAVYIRDELDNLAE